jgi:hypothetical protein
MMDKKTTYTSIRMIGIGQTSASVLRKLNLLDSQECLFVHSEKDIDQERMQHFCKHADLTILVVDLGDSNAIDCLLATIASCNHLAKKTLTVVKNAHNDPRLIRDIKRHTSVLDIDKQENNDVALTLYQLHGAFYHTTETIRCLEDEISAQGDIKTMMEKKREYHIRWGTNTLDFSRRLATDYVLSGKLFRATFCWVSFDALDHGAIINAIASIEENLGEDTSLRMHQKVVNKKNKAPHGIALLIGF